MMSMQKTTFGSKFAVFEENSCWYESVFQHVRNGQATPVVPTKKKKDYGSRYYDYSECDEIVILQLQQEDGNFMIEYVYK